MSSFFIDRDAIRYEKIPSTRWAVSTRKCHYSYWRREVFCPHRRVVSSDFLWRWYYHNIISKKHGLESDSCTSRPRKRVWKRSTYECMILWTNTLSSQTSDGIDTDKGRTEVEELSHCMNYKRYSTQESSIHTSILTLSSPRLKLPPKGILNNDRFIIDMKSISKESYHQISVFSSDTL